MSERILVIRLGSLGDIILTSAAITNLRLAFPSAEICLLCKEKYREAAGMIEGVDDLITIPDGISGVRYYAFLLKLDNRNFSHIIDLQGNFRSWAARKLLTADRKVVYPKRRFERILAVKHKAFPKVWPHTIDLYNHAVQAAGARAVSRRPHLKTGSDGQREKSTGLFKNDDPIVVFAPGAAHATKQYPVDRFVEAAVAIHQKNKANIVWAVTSEDVDKGDPGILIDEGSFVRLTDSPIRALAPVIERADLTIANDSGIAHLSSAVGTPTIAVFGPTHPVLGFAPAGINDMIAQVDEFCRPCSLHGSKPCYRDEQYCFTKIAPARIAYLADGLLGRRIRHNRAVFLDRDGTVIVEKHFLGDPDKIEFESGAIEALKELQNASFKLIFVSNQSGIARGKLDIDAVESVNARLLEMLTAQHVFIDAIYYCPHHPEGSITEYRMVCDCRKPAPGMVEEAAYQLDIDLSRSYVVGDKLDDVNLGKVMGGHSVMVTSGYGKAQSQLLDRERFHSDVTVVDNLKDAAKFIIGQG
jgi:D,D-heptose 1,7-bisphosphate phosphatase